MKHYHVMVITKKGDYPYFLSAINGEAAAIQVRLEHVLKGRPSIQTFTVIGGAS